MSLLDALLSVIAPHDCLNCGREGALLCRNCTVMLIPALQTCWVCQKCIISHGACANCVSKTALKSVSAPVTYEGAAKEIVWRLKYDGAQSAARTMARTMLPAVADYDRRTVLVPVPTSARRRRQRGYDQAELLARNLSKLTGLRYQNLLARSGEAHQVGASRAVRRQQLRGVFRVKAEQPLPVHILLIDDVMTTGATLEAAAAILRQLGVTSVSAAVFARVK